MAINIIENFDLGASKPLDVRFVVGTGFVYETKEDITYKYLGMRVWESGTSQSYIWTGTWSSDTSVISGTAGYLVKYNTSNSINTSLIYDNGISIGINTISPDASSRLDVSGKIKATSFQGSGSSLTGLNASNISSGSLSLARLSAGGSGNVLAGATASATWTPLTTLTVGNSLRLNVNDNVLDESIKYILGADGSGEQLISITSSIGYYHSTGALSLGTNFGGNRLNVYGSACIGNDIVAPSNGLAIQGETTIGTVNEVSDFTGKYLVTWDSSGGNLEHIKMGGMPFGGIILWSGSTGSLPAGWALCNGSTYSSTLGTVSSPNLVGTMSTNYIIYIGYPIITI